MRTVRPDGALRAVTGLMFDEGTTTGEALKRVVGKDALVHGKLPHEIARSHKHDLETMHRAADVERRTAAKMGSGWIAAPYPTWRQAVLLRKEKRYQEEVEVIRKYLAKVPSSRMDARIVALRDRLPKAEALAAKAHAQAADNPPARKPKGRSRKGKPPAHKE